MKRPNSYALYLCHAAVQSDAEAAAKKAKANEEWYEHNKEWKKEYNQEYYQQNKEYWEKRYAEQKSAADSAEENMKRAQQEYADYSRSTNTQPTTDSRITKLKSSEGTGTSSDSTSSKTETNKNTEVAKATAATAASSDSKYDLSSITKEEMDIANKVIRGDFKNGKTRKELLKKYIEENKANVDPVKIQKYVNILAKVGYNWNKSGIKTPTSSTSSGSTKSSTSKSSSTKSKSYTKKATSSKTTTKKKSNTSTKKTTTTTKKNANTAAKALVNAKLANDTNAQAKALALYNH